MKTIAHVIGAVILTSTLTAHGKTHDAGTTYEVEIVRNNGRVTTGVCLTLHQSGRVTMSDEALTMLWAPREHFPSQFMAVTAPGERTVVPYHLGVYGTALPDKSVVGRGIDQTGNTFVFRGQANDDCGGDLSERAASNSIQATTDSTKPRKVLNPTLDPCWSPDGSQVPCDPIPDPLRAANSHQQELIQTDQPCWSPPGSHAPCDPIPNPLRAANSHQQELIQTDQPCWSPPGSHVPCDPIPNPLRAANSHQQELIQTDQPCWSPPGSHVPCDPIPNPLRGDAETVTTSTLAGRSFRLTLGTSDQSVLEYCWTFGENHEIKSAQSKALRWSPVSSANGVAGFQSVGAGANGRGMAYYGALIGDELLEVVGIEARDGESIATYGYGQQVSACR